MVEDGQDLPKQSADTWWRAARWAYDAVQSYAAEIRRFTSAADLEEDQLLELFAREAEVDEHELRRLLLEWERQQESGAD